MNEINETEFPLVERSGGKVSHFPSPLHAWKACWGSTVRIWKSWIFSIHIRHSVMLKFMLYYYFLLFLFENFVCILCPTNKVTNFWTTKNQAPQIGEWKSTTLVIFYRFAWPCRNCDWPCRNYSSLLGTLSSRWGRGRYLLIAIGVGASQVTQW